MSANEAASRSEEAKAQYCNINAYNDFMEMLADEIKIAVNNGWTSTMPLRWGYLPDGYANKVITELSELGYKVSTIEDKMTVSWYDCKLHKYESRHSIQTNRLFEKKTKQPRETLIKKINTIKFDYGEILCEYTENEYRNPPDYAEYVADRLLADGIVVPPCKVGETVFVIINSYTPRYSSIATVPFATSLYDNIGKTVFLTREEAEKALKEIKKNESI